MSDETRDPAVWRKVPKPDGGSGWQRIGPPAGSVPLPTPTPTASEDREALEERIEAAIIGRTFHPAVAGVMTVVDELLGEHARLFGVAASALEERSAARRELATTREERRVFWHLLNRQTRRLRTWRRRQEQAASAESAVREELGALQHRSDMAVERLRQAHEITTEWPVTLEDWSTLNSRLFAVRALLTPPTVSPAVPEDPATPTAKVDLAAFAALCCRYLTAWNDRDLVDTDTVCGSIMAEFPAGTGALTGKPKGNAGNPHETCGRYLVDQFAGKGIEVTVTTERPLVDGPYTSEGFVCPHGVSFWPEPTGEQIARWAEDGVS